VIGDMMYADGFSHLRYDVGVTLISPQVLRKQLDGHHKPIVIDARPAEEYRRDHIPGAILLDWTNWCNAAPPDARKALHQPGYWGTLADRPIEWYADRLSALGISSDRPIVVYADGSVSKGRDGRIAWMLLYLGARSVALLDSGWQSWRNAGGAVETIVATQERGQFVVKPQRLRRCTRSDLQAGGDRSACLQLVDIRSADEFEGRLHFYQPRMGHLPSAVLIPFTDLFAPSGRYIDRTAYGKHVPTEVQEASLLLAYCEVGVRACTFALLHEIYTGQVVQVYDGSIMEWSLDPQLPVQAAG
jgi:thiosulfate/3-mercaptopyruvate sulfurtransferase